MARLLVVSHAVIVVFNLAAPFWAWRRPWVRVLHLVSMAVVLAFALGSGSCPLTSIEDAAWQQAEVHCAPGGKGFVVRALYAVVFWDIPQGVIEWTTAGWFALWAGVYLWLWRREKEARRALKEPAAP